MEGLAIGDIDIFYGHLVYFTAIWYTLWTFGIFCGNFVYFTPFWYVVPRKIWQPCFRLPLQSAERPISFY
jgi:hypothetical protein